MFVGRQDISNYWKFPPRFPESATNFWYQKLLDMIVKIVCENFFLRPTCLFGRFCWNASACSLSPATTTQLFSRSLSSHIFCSCLEFLSTTVNGRNLWRSKIQQVSTYAFSAGTIYLPKNGIAVFPKIFASAPNARPHCRPLPLQNGNSTCLEATIL